MCSSDLFSPTTRTSGAVISELMRWGFSLTGGRRPPIAGFGRLFPGLNGLGGNGFGAAIVVCVFGLCYNGPRFSPLPLFSLQFVGFHFRFHLVGYAVFEGFQRHLALVSFALGTDRYQVLRRFFFAYDQ